MAEATDWQDRLVGAFMIFAGLSVALSNGHWWGFAAGVCIGVGMFRVMGRRGV